MSLEKYRFGMRDVQNEPGASLHSCNQRCTKTLKSTAKQKIYPDVDISKGQRSQLKALPTDNAGTIRQQYKLNNIHYNSKYIINIHEFIWT